jgi:broad specificity phosphatase PhoE
MNTEMTTLFLCRNAVSKANDEDRFTAASDLSVAGTVSAWLLGNRLRTEQIGPIYASTSQNASRTAEVAVSAMARGESKIERCDALRQIDLGEWEGSSSVSVRSKGEWVKMTATPASITTRVPGGESIEEVAARAEACCREIIQGNHGENILLVSHGLVIRLLLCSFLRLEPTDYLWSFRIGNASVSKIEIPEGGEKGATLAILNSQDFLPADLRVQVD